MAGRLISSHRLPCIDDVIVKQDTRGPMLASSLSLVISNSGLVVTQYALPPIIWLSHIAHKTTHRSVPDSVLVRSTTMPSTLVNSRSGFGFQEDTALGAYLLPQPPYLPLGVEESHCQSAICFLRDCWPSALANVVLQSLWNRWNAALCWWQTINEEFSYLLTSAAGLST